MTIVQAYRRHKPYTHTFPWVTLQFKPNEHGDVVCDVAFQETVDALLATPTGFRLYDKAAPPDDQLAAILMEPAGKVATQPAEPERVDEDAPPVSPYALKQDDGSVVDLGAMNDGELHALAKANGVDVHHKAKGDTIRDKLVQHFTAED